MMIETPAYVEMCFFTMGLFIFILFIALFGALADKCIRALTVAVICLVIALGLSIPVIDWKYSPKFLAEEPFNLAQVNGFTYVLYRDHVQWKDASINITDKIIGPNEEAVLYSIRKGNEESSTILGYKVKVVKKK